MCTQSIRCVDFNIFLLYFTCCPLLFFVFYCCLCARERQPTTTTANLHTYMCVREKNLQIHANKYICMKFTSWVKLQTTHCSFHSVYFNWTTITDLVVSCCCCLLLLVCVAIFFCSFTSVLARTHTLARTYHTSCRRILCVLFFVRCIFRKYGDSLESKEHSQCTHIKIYISIVSYHFVSFVHSFWSLSHTVFCRLVAFSLSRLASKQLR